MLQPLEPTVDHFRGHSAARLILEYGDYECPYSRKAFREVLWVDRDRARADVGARIRRDVGSGLASREVLGTPTMFIAGVVHRGPYDAASLVEAVTGA